VIHVPHVNEFKLCYLDDQGFADRMLALRMLKAELFPTLSLEDCLNLFIPEKAVRHLKIQFAVELISKANNLGDDCGIILLIDDINSVSLICDILQQANETCQRFEGPLQHYLNRVMVSLDTLKLSCSRYVLPLFAGTSYTGVEFQFKGSTYPMPDFPLPLLSDEDVIVIAEEVILSNVLNSFFFDTI